MASFRKEKKEKVLNNDVYIIYIFFCKEFFLGKKNISTFATSLKKRQPIIMRRTVFAAFLCGVVSCCVMQVSAQNGPTMGWSSWNTYGVNINDELIRNQANAMVSKGLKNKSASAAINATESDNRDDDRAFSLLGREVDADNTQHAVVIKNGKKILK